MRVKIACKEILRDGLAFEMIGVNPELFEAYVQAGYLHKGRSSVYLSVHCDDGIIREFEAWLKGAEREAEGARIKGVIVGW